MPWLRMTSQNRATKGRYQDRAQERPSTPLDLEDFSSENSELLDKASEFLSDVLGCAETSGSGSSASSLSAIHAIRPDRKEQNRKRKKSVYKGNNKVDAEKLSACSKNLVPPKRARSAYVMFLKDTQRDKGKKWSELSSEDKRNYFKLAHSDEQRYVAELERYNEKLRKEVSLLRDKVPAPTQSDIAASATKTNTNDKAVVTPHQLPAPIENANFMPAEPKNVGRVSNQASNHHHFASLLGNVHFPTRGDECIPLAAGMEINVSHLPGMPAQRYQIQYSCVSMTIAQASEYIQNLGSAQIARSNLRS